MRQDLLKLWPNRLHGNKRVFVYVELAILHSKMQKCYMLYQMLRDIRGV